MKPFLTLVFLSLIALLLGACSSLGAVNAADQPADPTAVVSLPAEPTATQAEAAPSPQPTAAEVDNCLECHSNQQMLMDTADPNASLQTATIGLFWAGELPKKELWEKVLVNRDEFIPTVHGRFPCTSCHGGVQSSDKQTAHTNLNPNPSQGPEVVCGECHPNIEKSFSHSLHSSVQGFWTDLEARTSTAKHATLEGMFQQNCQSCHNTCGDCHVSQPKSVGGGLLDGHTFQRTPPMNLSCISCHGNSTGAEYLGTHADIPADVHYRQGELSCTSCHSSNELHGEYTDCRSCHPGPEADQLPPPDHRYGGVQTPACETCHPTVATEQDQVIMHQMHGSKLACQVCHSVSYTNCSGCHTGTNAQTGQADFSLDSTSLQFLIGRNPDQSYDRPYEYVVVRHAPVARDSFDSYGKDLLPNFDTLETWHYATPHNIQRKTPQAQSCNTCHGNPEYFLTADKVDPDELKANRKVIVEQIPAPITSADQLP